MMTPTQKRIVKAAIAYVRSQSLWGTEEWVKECQERWLELKDSVENPR